MHINDNSKPLVFLGTNYAMYKLAEVCEQYDITVAGIIDKDYWGNTKTICGIPVIDSEDVFNDSDKLANYRKNYNFFCATNWIPTNDPISNRNRNKRMYLLDLIDQLELNCISLVDNMASLSKHAIIGKGVFLDAFTLVEPEVIVGDFSNIYSYSGLGHNTKFGRNCVVQRHCSIAGDCTFEDNVFLGTAVKALKTGAVFGEGTFIHEGIYIRRGTVASEVVSITGVNQKRIMAPYID